MLVQTSTVEDYHYQFEILSNQIFGVSDSFLQSCFYSDLLHDIRGKVYVFQPTSLFQAASLAKLMEQKLN